MPPSRNPTLEEVAMQEDSDDDDYDDKETVQSRSRSKKRRQRGRTSGKRQRTRRGSDDDDLVSDEDEDDLGNASFSEAEHALEVVERSSAGRPLRNAAKVPKQYEEPSSSSEGDNDDSPSDSDDAPKMPVKKTANRRLIVKLKTGNTPVPPARNLHTRSSSLGGKRPATSSDLHPRGTRRSSRIAHDDEEPVVALTNSGNHVEIVRAGSKDPEGIPARAMRGGKGLKYPSKSTIDEEDDSGRTKEEIVEELEIQASQHEIHESDPQTQGDYKGSMPRLVSDLHTAAEDSADELAIHEETEVVLDTGNEEEGDDEDDGPMVRGRTRAAGKRKAEEPPDEPQRQIKRLRGKSLKKTGSKRPTRRGMDESSDFAPENDQEGDDDLSESSQSEGSPRKEIQRMDDNNSSSNGRRSARLRKQDHSKLSGDSEEEQAELAEEMADLEADRRQRRRRRPVEILYEDTARSLRGPRAAAVGKDYRLLRPELNIPIEDLEDEPSHTPSRRGRGGGGGGAGGGWQRSLFSTYGPFGGAGGLAPVLGGPGGAGAAGGVDSDSSDDEVMQKPKPVGGVVGMTPTSLMPSGGFPFFPTAQTLNADPAQAATGTPANIGKIKDRQALADADPLGVDQNVNFDGVGGLQGHIDQLKEMVSLPLLYPEIFMRFHITPPRGVLFHGPPGTGKTLLARALASSVSSQGKKVTFYMRKGADALSKWVGEAERQLRLLFEEARKNQPSIIFFDEIDGLAPVRSSKQEQIHASIVSTLLALMDGMDGRGQVIVIGATNRPDSIDPALRRPGRFDREFYFPLPNTEARRAILDIHTKGWDPLLEDSVKSELAELTKGYAGADLRALCTEAALNAVQRRYPQIYKANEKLLIDPATIEVTPKDFMISIKKMIPSSERSASSGASPLPAVIEPLLRTPLSEIKTIVSEILPQKKKTTALEEAQYEDVADGKGFRREKLQQAFETSRVFRPRLLIRGAPGMGQQYLAAALLNHFEGLHVQSFDLPTLLSDSSTSPEATMVRLFSEVKMHKPSVIYIPNVQVWYSTVGPSVVSIFLGLLRSLSPTDPILLLGVLEGAKADLDPDMLRNFFGYSTKNQILLGIPDTATRHEFFSAVIEYIKITPPEFPDPTNRKKRVEEVLKPAPPEADKPPPPPSKEELKAQKKRDRQTLNLLKIRLQPIMDQIRTKYKKFRTAVIEESQIRYLYDEADPGTVSSDLPTEMVAHASFRPFEIGKDAQGEPGLTETGTGKFYYNLDTVTIEKRLSNGYYKRPKDFLADVKRLAKDARTYGDQERLLKANELLTNVEVDVGSLEAEPGLVTECERVYQRELVREKEAIEKARKAAEEDGIMAPPRLISNVSHGGASLPSTVNASTGPIVLGEPMSNGRLPFPFAAPVTPSRPSTTAAATATYPATRGGDFDYSATNGSTSHMNGTDGDAEGDTEMVNTESHPASQDRRETQKSNSTEMSSLGATQSAQPRPIHSYTAPSQKLQRDSGMSAPLSQTGAFTPMAPGSQAPEYENDASTTQTTSGRKHSGPSSGSKEDHSNHGPNLYLYDERHSAPSAGGSDYPDTQGTNPNSRPASSQERLDVPFFDPMTDARDVSHSQGSANGHPSQDATRPTSSQSHSQPPVPAWDQALAPLIQPAIQRGSTNIQALLNDENDSHDTAHPQSRRDRQHNLLVIDHAYIQDLHRDITDRTTGCTVEQLEQVNSALMDTVWKMRGEWDRTKVAKRLGQVCTEVLTDMQQVQQHFEPPSWGRNSTQD